MQLTIHHDRFVRKSRGVIRYDPRCEQLGGQQNQPFWGLLECDKGIMDLYHWLLRRHGYVLHKGSLWGAHVTWCRGEAPKIARNWKRYDGLSIDFHYSPIVHWANGFHAWVNVHCPDLNDLRDSLGLKPLPERAAHLTIGRFAQTRRSTKTRRKLKRERHLQRSP